MKAGPYTSPRYPPRAWSVVFPDGMVDDLPRGPTLREALEITKACANQGEAVRFRQVVEEIDRPLAPMTCGE